MALKIRLRQQGRRNRPFYRVVVADAEAPREGRYLDNVGWYNPLEASAEKSLHLQPEKIEQWLKKGAQITQGVRPLIKKGSPHILQMIHEQKKQKQTKRRDQRLKSIKNASV